MTLQKIKIIAYVLLVSSAVFSEAWAADSSPFTRADYDLIMRWVNFLILAAVVVKYARTPLKNFFTNQRAQIARSIEQLEDKKRRLEEKIREGRTQLKSARERLQIIKEKIIEEGRNRREEIIAEAQRESQLMLESAQLKIQARIREGGQRIRSEIVDMAVDMAAEKLPRLLKADDHQRFVAEWMEAVK